MHFIQMMMSEETQTQRSPFLVIINWENKLKKKKEAPTTLEILPFFAHFRQ